MQKSKVAVIGLKGLPAFGGAATVGENIIEQLKDEYNFTVYSLSSHTNLKTGDYRGYKQIVFKCIKNTSLNTLIYYIKSLLHVLTLKNKFDLIFLHHSDSGFITPFLRIRYKVVLVLHGTFFNHYDPKFNLLVNKFFKWSERLNMKYANCIISVSKPNAIACRHKFKRDILHIPNGVNLYNTKKEQPKSNYFVFSASRIYELKGLHFLLNALKIIKSNKTLLVIGDLDQKIKYKEYILSIIKDLNVKFIPIIKDKVKLFDLISKAELFIFPSTTEAMSMMLLEVAALSVPIIASDIPGNISIFNDNEVLFFKSEDSESLANCITFATNNEIIMDNKAKNALSKVKTSYSWDNISEKYHSAFQKMI